MFRNREPLRVAMSTPLTHQEWAKNEQGRGEFRQIDDCRFLADPEDYDLEVQQRSGENLRAVSTILTRPCAVYPSSVPETEKESEKEN